MNSGLFGFAGEVYRNLAGIIRPLITRLVKNAQGTHQVIEPDAEEEANVNVVIAPKGTGALVAQVADGSRENGNARGSYSVDLQTQRDVSQGNREVRVASGSYSVIAGGYDNQVSGSYSSISGGSGSSASADYCAIGGGRNNLAGNTYASVSGGYQNNASQTGSAICGGSGNSASGIYTFIGGGSSNVYSGGSNGVIAGGTSNSIANSQTAATLVGGSSNKIALTGNYSTVGGGRDNDIYGQYSCIPGGYGAQIGRFDSSFYQTGKFAFASGYFSTEGDSQMGMRVLRRQSSGPSGSTPVILSADGGAVGTANSVMLQNNSTYAFSGIVVARRTDADGHNASWKVEGLIRRDTNAASTTLVGSTVTAINNEGDGATWALACQANTTNGSLELSATGEDNKTINWVAMIHTVETEG